MRTARVTFHDGNTVTTRINGTTAEILSYYLGRWFNLGPVEDHMAKAVAVEFLDDQPTPAPENPPAV
jgi:hypothetical protein